MSYFIYNNLFGFCSTILLLIFLLGKHSTILIHYISAAYICIYILYIYIYYINYIYILYIEKSLQTAADAEPAGGHMLQHLLVFNFKFCLEFTEAVLSEGALSKVEKHVDQDGRPIHWQAIGPLLGRYVDKVQRAAGKSNVVVLLLAESEHSLFLPSHNVGVITAKSKTVLPGNTILFKLFIDEFEDCVPCC